MLRTGSKEGPKERFKAGPQAKPPFVFRKGDGRCRVDNWGNSRANTSKLDFAEGLSLLDTELTQVPPGHVVIHDNLTNHVALPTMRHSSF